MAGLGTRETDPPYALNPEWYERIKPLSPGELADDTGAAFFLMIGVGQLSEEETSGEYHPLGWKWPESPPESDLPPQ